MVGDLAPVQRNAIFETLIIDRCCAVAWVFFFYLPRNNHQAAPLLMRLTLEAWHGIVEWPPSSNLQAK